MAKSETLVIRVTPEEKEAFHAQARAAGLSVSEWLARAANASIRASLSNPIPEPEHRAPLNPSITEHPSTHEQRA